MRRATWNPVLIARTVTFQSTLSMRRATCQAIRIRHSSSSISIHALHEESDTRTVRPRRDRRISIHALHEESDLRGSTAPCVARRFQSTLSMRRATTPHGCLKWLEGISIHALHEESDSAAGHFCPLFETQASCLALSISNNTADTTNNMSKTSNWLSVSF